MWRRILASILVVIGALLLLVSSFGWWANRYFLNSERFSAKASQIVANEDVQDALTVAITTQISKSSGRDLRIAEPIIGTIVRQVVQSEQFKTVFHGAVLRAHRAVVGGGGRQVVLDLTETLDDVKSALGTIAPNLAEKIPPGDEVQVKVFDKTQLDTIYDITNLTKKAVVVVTILALLFLGAGVALSSRRWKTLALAGWVTVGVFVFSLIGVVIGRMITGSFVERDEFRPGVEAAYRIITRGLIVQAFVLGILGLLVALAAGWIDRHGGWASAREAVGKGTTWARRQLPKKAPAAPVDAATGVGLATATATGTAAASGHDTSVAFDETATAGEMETPRSIPQGVLASPLPPPGRKARAVHWWRAAALALVGLYAVFNPRSLTSIVVVLIGVAALYLAITEAIAAWAAPPEPKADDEIAEDGSDTSDRVEHKAEAPSGA
jgi:hypothetical protein